MSARSEATLAAVVARLADAGYGGVDAVFSPYGLEARRHDGSLVDGQAVQYSLRRAGYAAFEARNRTRGVWRLTPAGLAAVEAARRARAGAAGAGAASGTGRGTPGAGTGATGPGIGGAA